MTTYLCYETMGQAARPLPEHPWACLARPEPFFLTVSTWSTRLRPLVSTVLSARRSERRVLVIAPWYSAIPRQKTLYGALVSYNCRVRSAMAALFAPSSVPCDDDLANKAKEGPDRKAQGLSPLRAGRGVVPAIAVAQRKLRSKC